MGINAWNSFALGVEHPYIVGKSEKSLDWYYVVKPRGRSLSLSNTAV